MKNKLRKTNSGITLIALVITIIVLLILAGVTIATLTGDNGILTKATESKDKTEEAEAEEQVKLAIAGSIGEDGEIDNEELKDNLNKIEGIEEVGEISDSDYPISVTIDGEYSYLINKDGTIGEVVEREGIKVGDYINYTYDTVEEGYPLEQAKSGYTSDQTIAQTSGLKWRIMNIDASGRVDLISETPTNQTVYFRGARGYNNGVLLINDICESLYSNNSLGITARSIDLKDIEDNMNASGITARDEYNKDSNSGTQYGNTKTYTGRYTKYPNLYAQENGSGINTETVKKNGIDVNADGYDSPTAEDSSTADGGLTVTQTYYNMSSPSSYFDDQEFYKLVFGTNSYYWLASRYAGGYSPSALFGLRDVYDSDLGGNYMFYSYGYADSNGRYLRPVVSLGSDIQITPCTGENSSSNMHQISK